MKVLPKSFYKRNVLDVAPDLLGKYLVRILPSGEIVRSKITEVEAYDGEKDLACHASKGKTERTSVMYEEGGIWYIYLVYGMHNMLNIVTGEKDYPAAVLIRGVEDISGPGRLTKNFKIDRNLNGLRSNRENNLWIEEGESVKEYTTTPRIGVQYAREWALKPYRFILK